MHIFRLIYADNRTVDIKATHFSSSNGAYYFWTVPENDANYSNYSAHINNSDVTAVIRLDMLVESIHSHLYFPEIVTGQNENIDLINDAIFSLDERIPFSPEERKAISKAIDKIQIEIVNNYNPTGDALTDIEEKLNYLQRKVDQLTKFDWKRLLVTTMIGISIDLGFGTTLPSSLLDFFKNILSHFASKLLEKGTSKDT